MSLKAKELYLRDKKICDLIYLAYDHPWICCNLENISNANQKELNLINQDEFQYEVLTKFEGSLFIKASDSKLYSVSTWQIDGTYFQFIVG